MTNERIEAEFTVPTGITVSASNSGGGATTVTVTPGATFITDLCADLQTQLNNTRPPASGAWVVLFAGGQVTIACDNTTTATPAFSLDWGSTVLRDTFGFEYNINYPLTAAELARQVGYGTWTAAWLFNETSGDASAAFGSQTLTKSGTVTYSIAGPRGGADKAISFTTGTSAQFSGGDVYDVTATDDLCFVWVAYHTGAPAATRSLVNKYSAGNPRWFIQVTSGLVASFVANNGTTETSSSVTLPTGSWYVGMAAASRGSGNLRIGYCPIGGSPTVGNTGTAPTGTWANSANFCIGQISGLLDALENMNLAYAAIGVGTSYASGLVTNMSTALQNFANAFGNWTGSTHVSGAWYPNAPYVANSDPKQAPRGDDRGSAIAPTGRVFSMGTTEYYRHRNVRFSHVAKSRVWSADATTVGADWETFYLETQNGHHAWFDLGSRVKIYWDNAGVATELGNGSVDAWYMPNCTKLDDLQLSVNTWTGLVNVVIGDVFSDG